MAKRGFRYAKHIRDAFEKAYKENPKMQGWQYKNIASDLGLKTQDVRRWFVSKRYRTKKNTNNKKDELRNTGDRREDKTSNKTKTLTDAKSNKENKGRTIVIVIGEEVRLYKEE